MITLKNFIKDILSVFVFLRFKTVRELYTYLFDNNKKSGIEASVFTRYCEKHSSFIGIGARFASWPHFPHGLFSIFICDRAVIGRNCVIFQQTTIGNVTTKGSKNIGSPVIGDNCYIACGAKIIGNVHIGNNVRIGANAVVYKDVPDNCTVTGNCLISKKNEPLNNDFYLLNDDTSMLRFDFDKRDFIKEDIE